MTLTFPNYPEKHREEAMIRARAYLDYLQTVGKYPETPAPESVIFCFSPRLREHLEASRPGRRGDRYFSSIWFPDEAEGRVGLVSGYGIGAPATVPILEDLIGFGARRFVSIGTAGALQPDLDVGDIIVCDSAIRDEGTSHHYVPPARYAHPSALLTRRLSQELESAGLDHRLAPSWTTDAPYRETRAEVEHYREEGVATVEMEAAALFAVASYRGVDVASVFVVSDTLGGPEWKPDFYDERVQANLRTLYPCVLRTLDESAKT